MNIKGLIFANSIKHYARCIAGKNIDTGQWFRLVYNVNGDAIPNKNAIYYDMNNNGQELKPLVVIEIPVLNPAPIIGQPENIILDYSNRIKQVAPYEINDFSIYMDNPPDLWGNGDSISNFQGKTVSNSLYLIKPKKVNLYYREEKKRRIEFLYNGIKYDLGCTSPNFDDLINKKEPNIQALCISLGENFNNFHYKIVASIL